jgi:carbon-monoxide dehydrogenase large subunit
MHDSQAFRRSVGSSQRRPDARRAMEGRAVYLDDVHLPGLLHVAFLRSPHAHGLIRSIDTTAAAALPGVVRVVTASDLAPVCTSWGSSNQFPGLVDRQQFPLAPERASYQGEAVAAVVAESRAVAEDALELIHVEWEPLPAAARLSVALEATPLAHPDLPSNLAFSAELGQGGTEAAFADAAHVVEDTFVFNRITGTPIETRGVVASYVRADGSLTVWQSQTAPHTLRALYARLLAIEEGSIRVICPTVGGSFGIKIHLYADEVATCALSKLLGRPVKYVADRIESFVTDIHAREHIVRGRLALDRDGTFVAMEVVDRLGIGPFSNYPMSSVHEGMGAVRTSGSPYRIGAFKGRLEVAFQNKTITGQYRGVGHPIACAVTEALVDKAAAALGTAPEELRRRNYTRAEDYPYTHAAGVRLDALSHAQCLDKLLTLMGLPALRREQAELRGKGIHRGIGLSAFVELTAPGPAAYVNVTTPNTTQDGIVLNLDPSGHVRCATSVTEQGQGTHTVIAQIVAKALGVRFEDVTVTSGDSAATPYGGGARASRTTAIGGEVALKAALALKTNVLDCAAALLQAKAEELTLENGMIAHRTGAAAGIELATLANMVHCRPHLLPAGAQTQLSVAMHLGHDWPSFIPTNGIQASYLEVDTGTGMVRLLRHWSVDDFGTIINPLLTAEQVRGGIAQGIGQALYEELIYSEAGQLTNGTFVDYLVPKASDMPDIVIGHVETPWPTTELGAKGAGEAGTTAAVGAVLNAVNDALAPLGCRVTELPITPERILRALGKI